MKQVILCLCMMILVSCQPADAESWDYPPGIMYEGNLYITSTELLNKVKIGDLIGEVESVIDGSQGMPTQDNQSNIHRLGDPIYAYGRYSTYIVVECNGVYELFEKQKKQMTMFDVEKIDLGMTQEDIHTRFGQPKGVLSGLFGDIYLVEDKRVIIYYDFDETKGHPVLEVKISDQEDVRDDTLYDLPLYNNYGAFVVYAHAVDGYDYKDQIDELEEHVLYLENKYGLNHEDVISILIHENQEAFDQAVANDLFKGGMGYSKGNEIHVLAPYAEHEHMSFSKFESLFIHEYNHLYFSYEGPLRWFDEGLATYESPTYNKYTGSSVKHMIKQGHLSIDQLMQGDFLDYSGPASIIEFIEREYGVATIIEIVKHQQSIHDILNLSDDELNAAWMDYINENY